MDHREIIKALRDKDLTWKQIGKACEVCGRTAQNWGTKKHNGPGPAALRLLKQLALREGVL